MRDGPQELSIKEGGGILQQVDQGVPVGEGRGEEQPLIGEEGNPRVDG